MGSLQMFKNWLVVQSQNPQGSNFEEHSKEQSFEHSTSGLLATVYPKLGTHLYA